MLVFLAGIFMSFSQPLAKGDLWWHLATGRWITEHRSLPSEDPFAFTTTTEPDTRRDVILKGFWLSQVLFYLTYKMAGYGGLVILKAGLMLACFAILLRIMTLYGINSYTSLLILFPLALLSGRFGEPRPQIFSFIGTLLLFSVLEKGINENEQNERPSLTSAISAPLLMLLWANLHRGFIIGHAVMGIYALTEAIKYLFGINALSRRRLLILLAWLSASFLASLINPNHINTLFVNLWELRFSTSTLTIDEYLPPWRYSTYAGAPYFAYGLLALALATVSVLILSIRQIKFRHVLLYLGFWAAAASSFRFCIFFILMSVAICSKYLALILENRDTLISFLRKTSIPLLIASTFFMGVQSYDKSFIKTGAVSPTVPVEAADYMARRSQPPNIFNSYDLGAYLIWRLYPQYKVFIDGRAISNDTLVDYMSATLGKEESVFKANNINTAALNPFHPITLNVPPILFKLLKDDSWRLVYFDRNTVIMVRSSAMPTATLIDKEVLWDSLIHTTKSWISIDPEDPRLNRTLGQIQAARGGP